jgi:serine/threonine protein kinase
MAANSSDDYWHWSTPDEPHPSPAPDVSQDKVTPASLSYDLLGLSLSMYPEPPTQSLKHLASWIDDADHEAPEHAARARRSVEGRKGATLSRLQVLDELGIIPGLLEDPSDYLISALEVMKNRDPVKSSIAFGTPDLKMNGFSVRTGPRQSKAIPHSWDQASVTSLQTFETALSSTGSYTTAPSAFSYFDRWTASNTEDTEEWLTQNRSLSISHSCLPPKDWHFDHLVRSIACTCGESSENVRATATNAAKKELFVLRDPFWDTSTLVEDLIESLVSRLVRECGDFAVTLDKESFRQKARQFIGDYALQKPHLLEAVKKSLSVYKTFESQWLQLLKAHNLILDPKEALDWSGRGQHVEYSLEEQESIPLVSKGNLGFGASGIVDRVRCRRIDLARKTIRCIRKPTREEAAKEIRHLQELQHRHTVRLVGTYMLKKNLSILMYPATEYSLDGFLDVVYDDLSSSQVSTTSRYLWCTQLLQVIACLVNAVAFIHAQNTKHMDIKPNNILVDYSGGDSAPKVFITDFGIARSYQSTEESFTDSPISCTRIYKAPEVAQQTTRGPPADIFSLGCVFMEILATLLSTEGNCQQERLRQARSSGTDNSYQANIENVVGWYEGQKNSAAARLLRTNLVKQFHLDDDYNVNWEYLLPMMLSVSPERRPSAAELKKHTQHLACGSCDDGPEPFKAAT